MDSYWWVLVLIYVVISALGSVMSSRQEARRRSPGRPQPAGGPQQQPQPRRRPTQTPEEIAAEIRRVMGMERREPERLEVGEPREEPVVSREDASAYAVEPEHGGKLHAHLMARRASAARDEARRKESRRTLSSLSDRYRKLERVEKLAAVRREVGAKKVDLSDVARAFVSAEILGPPVALREDRRMP